MALETLKGVEVIGGYKVAQHNQHTQTGGFVINTTDMDQYITVDHEENSIKFDIQDGPIKERGVNGCQVDTLIHAALYIIGGLNTNYPNKHNIDALAHLTRAIDSLNQRTKDREARGVEGRSEK